MKRLFLIGFLLLFVQRSVSASAPATPENRNVGDAALRPPKYPKWKGCSLIANNVSAFNGGSGIHTFRTSHVDIINNITYSNGQITGYPELYAHRSEDVVILNNIIVPRTGAKITSNNKNTNTRWDFNLYPTAQTIVIGANDVVAEPRFIDPQFDLTKADFRLGKDSRGRNSGVDDVAQTTDSTGKARSPHAGRDRGALEQ